MVCCCASELEGWCAGGLVLVEVGWKAGGLEGWRGGGVKGRQGAEVATGIALLAATRLARGNGRGGGVTVVNE
jgi:hypothetical protein